MNHQSTSSAHAICSREVARHTLWFFGDTVNGHCPGSFTASLYDAMARADACNLSLLAQGFPAEVWAFRQAQGVPGGMRALANIANGVN